MSTEANKALIRRGIEELNQGNVLETSASWDELFVPDFVRHDPAGGFRSREDYKRFLSRLLVALPGHFTIEDLIAEGDKVVLRYTCCFEHNERMKSALYGRTSMDARALILQTQPGRSS